MNTENNIEFLKQEIERLKLELRIARHKQRHGIVDESRIKSIDVNRGDTVASYISYIARASVDGNPARNCVRNKQNVLDKVKLTRELTEREYEVAVDVANKIIDIYEQAFNKKAWDNNEN